MILIRFIPVFKFHIKTLPPKSATANKLGRWIAAHSIGKSARATSIPDWKVSWRLKDVMKISNLHLRFFAPIFYFLIFWQCLDSSPNNALLRAPFINSKTDIQNKGDDDRKGQKDGKNEHCGDLFFKPIDSASVKTMLVAEWVCKFAMFYTLVPVSRQKMVGLSKWLLVDLAPCFFDEQCFLGPWKVLKVLRNHFDGNWIWWSVGAKKQCDDQKVICCIHWRTQATNEM